MADMDLVVGEFGFNYDFTIFDDVGAVDVSGFDLITLDIRPTNYTDALLLDSKVLIFGTDGTDGLVRWAVQPADIPTTVGVAYAQITLGTNANTALRRTKQMTVMIHREIT